MDSFLFSWRLHSWSLLSSCSNLSWLLFDDIPLNFWFPCGVDSFLFPCVFVSWISGLLSRIFIPATPVIVIGVYPWKAICLAFRQDGKMANMGRHRTMQTKGNSFPGYRSGSCGWALPFFWEGREHDVWPGRTMHKFHSLRVCHLWKKLETSHPGFRNQSVSSLSVLNHQGTVRTSGPD